MNINLRCKLCESEMEIEYKNTDRTIGDIIVTCTNCGATGTFVCSSELLNKKNKLTAKETNLVLIATLQAASNAEIR